VLREVEELRYGFDVATGIQRQRFSDVVGCNATYLGILYIYY